MIAPATIETGEGEKNGGRGSIWIETVGESAKTVSENVKMRSPTVTNERLLIGRVFFCNMFPKMGPLKKAASFVLGLSPLELHVVNEQDFSARIIIQQL